MGRQIVSKGTPLGIGIIGCGLIGNKRAESLSGNLIQLGQLTACSDLIIERSERLAHNSGAKVFKNWEDLLDSALVDAVVVSAPHDCLVEITGKAIELGKHVLVEKPVARSSHEILSVISAAKKSNTKVHVGFNHRYHRSLRKAKELVDSGVLGELMYIRGRYGHGARIGYDKEWRAKPKISGGGELIDQGPHLIDLTRWFLGDVTGVQGFAKTYYWDMPVEDNAFMLLKTDKGQAAFLHVSCTEWKNLFSMEIFGKLGKLDLSGLGGSYGVEKITWYQMLPEMGPPETICWEYPMSDNSWEIEMHEFLEDIRLNRNPSAGLLDALAALKIIESIYKESGFDHCS